MPSITLSWQAPQGLTQATRDPQVELTPQGATVLRRVLLADEMGDCTGRDIEHIDARRWIRKAFQIDLPTQAGTLPVAGARLSVWLRGAHPAQALAVEVNGHPLELRLPAWPEAGAEFIDQEYWHRNWPTIEVPVEHLQPGLNVFAVRPTGGGAWETLIETGRHPNRSARSIDGGLTWDDRHLGYNDCYDGEYLVRLELDAYPPQGQLTSPPLDLAAAAAGDALGRPLRLLGLAARADADTPEGCAVSLEVRAGPNPTYDPTLWSAWAPADASAGRSGDRFAQWRVTLRTDSGARAPTLRAVHLTAEVEAEGAQPSEGVGWGRLAAANNPVLQRASQPFGYQAPYSRAEMLRERWQLDEVVAGAADDWERILRVAYWARDRWTDGWNRQWKQLHYCPPWDASLILEVGRHDLGVGMCTHYSTVFVQALASLGITARHVIHQSHCTAEAWSDHWGRWVWLDVGGDTDDETRVVYYVERDGRPLSALEARTAWLSGQTEGLRLAGRNEPHERFELVDRLRKLDRFCIVTRNDQLTSPHPGELEHGIVAYHYDGYLWWRDDQTPPLPYMSLSTSRAADLYWTLNRTRIHLQRTAERGTLQVQLESAMPNLAPPRLLGPDHHPKAIVSADEAPAEEAESAKGRLEVCLDAGEWQDAPAAFAWVLSAGANRLAARSVNAFGVVGPESWVRVEYV